MKFYIFKDDQEIGPFEEAVVEAKLRDNSFSLNDLARHEGNTEWKLLETFFPLFLEAPHGWMRDTGSQNSEPDNAARTGQHEHPFAKTQDEPQFSAQPQHNYQQPPVVHQSVQHVVHHVAVEPEGALPTVSLVGGIVCFCFFLLGLVPCLGWLNWFVLFGASLTKIFCWVTVFTVRNPSGRNKAIIGLLLTACALFFGGIRLIVGGGCV